MEEFTVYAICSSDNIHNEPSTHGCLAIFMSVVIYLNDRPVILITLINRIYTPVNR